MIYKKSNRIQHGCVSSYINLACGVCTYEGARTLDHWLKRPTLYRLSYAGV